jgi:hypothetical protein
MIQSFAAALGVLLLDAKDSVNAQSAAIPIRATFLVLGQPLVSPMVDCKFTPPVFPDTPLVSD